VDDGESLATIRVASDRDAAPVAALWTEAYVDEGEGGRIAPYAKDDFLETSRRGQVFVAEWSGIVVGVVALLAPRAPGRAVAREEAELSRLVVAVAARGHGIGKRLVTHCEDLAREADWPAIALWSRRYQTAAHRLYERLGYRRVPERDTVDATGHERCVFRLDLSGRERSRL
jgi:ribosomal protein S18 acetylase RimI-like enzyme